MIVVVLKDFGILSQIGIHLKKEISDKLLNIFLELCKVSVKVLFTTNSISTI